MLLRPIVHGRKLPFLPPTAAPHASSPRQGGKSAASALSTGVSIGRLYGSWGRATGGRNISKCAVFGTVGKRGQQTNLRGRVGETQMQDNDRTGLAEAEKLRELARWYREFAERAGSATIWAARVRMAEDLEWEADSLGAPLRAR